MLEYAPCLPDVQAREVGIRQTHKVCVIRHATPTMSMVLHAAALLRYRIKEKSLYINLRESLY